MKIARQNRVWVGLGLFLLAGFGAGCEERIVGVKNDEQVRQQDHMKPAKQRPSTETGPKWSGNTLPPPVKGP